MTAFRNLARDAKITENQLASTQSSIARLIQEIQATNTPSKAMVKELENLKRKGSDLKDSYNEIIQKQQALRTSMAENGVSTADLNRHQQSLKSDMAAATAEVEKQTQALQRQNKTQQAMRAARAEYDRGIEMRNRIAGAGATTLAAGVAMGAPLIKGVRDFATLEDARIGLAKQFDGAYDANERLTRQFLDFEKVLMSMAERLPLTTVEMYALAEGAARMGVKGSADLARFTEQAAIMQAAFDLPASEIAMDMGKIADLYKIPIKEIRELGDTINWLDDNAQSQGGDIIKVLQRIAGIATTAGMNFRDAAAFGSTFLSLGATEETAATATNAMIRELGVARMQSKRFQEGMGMVGLDSNIIQSSMAKDSTGTIIKVLEALKTLPKDQQLEAATRLFGKEYGDDASKLAQNIGELRRQLKLANDEEARGSMLRESQRRNQGLSSQWEMTKNALFNTDSSLSENLKPALIDIMTTIREVTVAVRDWTAEHPVLTAYLVKGTAALAILTIGLGALMLAIAASWGHCCC
ncbi:phage tail tape measure protein [Methylobacillus glycogenes]|uniref:phage tail tape measure protein n=1 Tax=Methylobacillus glycogenes TaxID=406 RepID=UPI00131F35F6|nr:phage tail tape measure protein [Methylobacillus glycogenes]